MTVEPATPATASIDADGRVLGLDAGAERLLGVNDEAARGRPFDELAVPPDLRAAFWSSLLGVVSGRTPLESPAHFRTRAQPQGGPAVNVDVTVIRSAGEPLELTVYATNVSEEGRRMASAERLLEIASDVASMAGWEYDLATGRRLHSPGFPELLGLPAGDRPELLRPEDIPFVDEEERQRFSDIQEAVLADPAAFVGRLQRFTTRVLLPDGAIRDVVSSFEVRADETGAPRWFSGVVQDTTATQSTEREMEALHAVRRSIQYWDDDTGFGDLVEALGAALDAPMAAMWIEDDAPGELWCRAFWSHPDLDADDIEAACRRVPLQKGAGATGRAYASGQPQYEVPNPASPYASALEEAGARVAMAFPAVYGDEVLAVVALAYMDPRPVDERLLTTFETLGVAVGRFLHSKRGELNRQSLTTRELQVLRLAAQGQTGPEIAERLGLSQATVKTHFKNVYDKLGVADRAAAVAQAFRLGLLS